MLTLVEFAALISITCQQVSSLWTNFIPTLIISSIFVCIHKICMQFLQTNITKQVNEFHSTLFNIIKKGFTVSAYLSLHKNILVSY